MFSKIRKKQSGETDGLGGTKSASVSLDSLNQPFSIDTSSSLALPSNDTTSTSVVPRKSIKKENDKITGNVLKNGSNENLAAAATKSNSNLSILTSTTQAVSSSTDSLKRISFFNKRFTRMGGNGESASPRPSTSPLSGAMINDDFDAATGEFISPISLSTSRESLTPGPLSPPITQRSNSLKRVQRRPESTLSSHSYGTFRFSRRFFDALGFEDNSDAQSVTFSADAIDGPEETDSNEIEDITSEYGISAILIPVQIFVGDSRTPISYKFNPRQTVGGTIQSLFRDILLISAFDWPEEKQSTKGWRLCKLDKNMIAARIWLNEDQVLATCKIKDGDELRLKHISDVNYFDFCVPPSKATEKFCYAFDDNIGYIVEDLVESHSLPLGQRYGLYYKKMGLWLDDKKPMTAYEIEFDDLIELRLISQEFLLRVNLPDADTRFTLKVIPALDVSDVISMINYNLKTKKITLQSHIRHFVDVYAPSTIEEELDDAVELTRKKTAYGLYRPLNKQWLPLSKTLEECGISSSGGLNDNLEFQIQYHPVTIALPENMISKRDDVLSTFGYDGRQLKRNLIQIMSTADTTVRDILEVLKLDNPDYRPDDPLLAFGLFFYGNQKLKDDDFIWKIFEDISEFEVLSYRMISRKVSCLCSQDSQTKVDLDIDPAMKFRRIASLICRRFGVNENTEFLSLRVAGSAKVIDLSKNFLYYKLTKNDVLILDLKPKAEIPPMNPDYIWAEIEDKKTNITYTQKNAQIVATATLNKLMEKLTSSDGQSDSAEYLDFLKTFLLTYHSFTTPMEFLAKLVERYHVPRLLELGLSFTDFERHRLKIQLRICNVLQQWTKKYFYDFVDFAGSLELIARSRMTKAQQEAKKNQLMSKHGLLIQVLNFVENTIMEDHPTIGKQIRKNIYKLRDGSYRTQKNYMRDESVAIPAPKYVKPSDLTNFNLFACEAEEIARQLTIIEFDLFSKIMPYENLNQAWTKKDAELRAPNVMAITKRFNEIAIWVVKSIIEVKTVKARAKRFSKLIDVAGYLYTLNNFSTLMAFIAGFNKAAVNRLKFTAKEMNSKTLRKFSELESIMSAEGAYKNYRAKLRNANPPCIPYIGVYLLDLTYIEDGNPDYIDDLINFSKRKLIYTLIRELQVFQDTPYMFRPVEDIVQALQLSIALPVQEEYPLSPTSDGQSQPYASVKEYEDYLFNLSLQREPRGAEKNQIA